MLDIFNTGKNLGRKTRIAISSAAVLLGLNGCGGSSSSDNNETSKLPDFLSVKLQGGIIVGSQVEIRSLSGDLLYTTSSDENGVISIDKEIFESKLSDNNLSWDSQIDIISDGGTDIDPDNDGDPTNDIDKKMKGRLDSILAAERIDGSFVNPMTTLYSDLVSSELDTNKTNINQIVSEVTSKLNITNSLFTYDIYKNDSGLETLIKESGYLDALYSGDNIEKIKARNKINQIQENNTFIESEGKYAGDLNISNKSGQTYVSPELQAQKTNLEQAKINLEQNLTIIDQNLTSLESQKSSLENNLSYISSDLTKVKSDLDILTNFENGVQNISFVSDSDDSLSTKINKLPNISNIGNQPLQSSSIKKSSIKRSSELTDNYDSLLSDLYDRKTLLESQIETITQEISSIDNDISSTQSQIDLKQKEIDDKKTILDKVEADIEQFKKDHKTEIANYSTLFNDYSGRKKEFNDLGIVPNLYLDIGSMLKTYTIDTVVSRIDERQKQITAPVSSDYITDTTTKEYSDLFTYTERVSSLFGATLDAKIIYGYESDYPAKIKFTRENGSETDWFTGIRNKDHKNDYKRFVGAFTERYILIGKLNELKSVREDLVDIFNSLSLAINDEIDLESAIGEYYNLEDTIKAYNDLKASLQPEIDSLNSQKSDLERLKITKRSLETKKSDLINQLNTLNEQIKTLSSKKTNIKSDISNLETEKSTLETEKSGVESDISSNLSEKDSIIIKIGENDEQLEDLNNQIENSSNLLSSYKGNIVLYGKVFELEVFSDKQGGDTKENLDILLEAKKQSIKENIKYVYSSLPDGTGYTLYMFSPNGDYPIYIWANFYMDAISKTTSVYSVQEDQEKTALSSLKRSIVKVILENKEENILNSEYVFINPEQEGNLLEAKKQVHYYQYSSEEKFPAKVGVKYRLGNQEFIVYSETFAYSETEINNVYADKLSDSLVYKHITGVNAGEQIWWNGGYLTMEGGEYFIYETPLGYVATYKVANQGTWWTSIMYSDANALETEINRICDNWVEKNRGEPVSESEDRSEELMEKDPNVLSGENIQKEIDYIKDKLSEQNANTNLDDINNYSDNISFMDNNTNSLADRLLDKYIADETLYIGDGENDDIEKNIVGALEGLSKGESIYIYINNLENLGISGEVLDRIKYLSYKMIYGEGTVDVTDDVLMIAGVAGLLKGGIKYIVQRSTGKVLFRMSYGQIGKEISLMSYDLKVFDLGRYVGITLKDIKAFNKNVYNRIKAGTLSLKNSEGVEYSFKRGLDKIKEHMNGESKYVTGNSYFKDIEIDNVLDLHIEAINKIPKNAFESIKGSSSLNYNIDLGRNIGYNLFEDGTKIITNKVGCKVNSISQVHCFPIHPNKTLGID